MSLNGAARGMGGISSKGDLFSMTSDNNDGARNYAIRNLNESL